MSQRNTVDDAILEIHEGLNTADTYDKALEQLGVPESKEAGENIFVAVWIKRFTEGRLVPVLKSTGNELYVNKKGNLETKEKTEWTSKYSEKQTIYKITGKFNKSSGKAIGYRFCTDC